MLWKHQLLWSIVDGVYYFKRRIDVVEIIGWTWRNCHFLQIDLGTKMESKVVKNACLDFCQITVMSNNAKTVKTILRLLFPSLQFFFYDCQMVLDGTNCSFWPLFWGWGGLLATASDTRIYEWNGAEGRQLILIHLLIVIIMADRWADRLGDRVWYYPLGNGWLWILITFITAINISLSLKLYFSHIE